MEGRELCGISQQNSPYIALSVLGRTVFEGNETSGAMEKCKVRLGREANVFSCLTPYGLFFLLF